MKVNVDTVKSLIARHANDGEMIDLIVDCLESFESYHKAIYSLEIQRELYARGAMDSETYRELVPHLDKFVLPDTMQLLAMYGFLTVWLNKLV